MTLINQDTKLCDIILQEPSTITVLDRFGISLGVGDVRIIDACHEHDIDVNFFITILNTYINENYFPQAALLAFSTSRIIEYLAKTNEYYERNVIPNIERHFAFLISKTLAHKSDSASQSQACERDHFIKNSNLVLMRQFFEEVKIELLQRIEEDRNKWFPTIALNEMRSIGKMPHPVKDAQDISDPIEEKIDDLINMLIMHLKGDYDHNLGYAVITAIFSLKKDIKQNNRIRYRILQPISQALNNK